MSIKLEESEPSSTLPIGEATIQLVRLLEQELSKLTNLDPETIRGFGLTPQHLEARRQMILASQSLIQARRLLMSCSQPAPSPNSK